MKTSEKSKLPIRHVGSSAPPSSSSSSSPSSSSPSSSPSSSSSSSSTSSSSSLSSLSLSPSSSSLSSSLAQFARSTSRVCRQRANPENQQCQITGNTRAKGALVLHPGGLAEIGSRSAGFTFSAYVGDPRCRERERERERSKLARFASIC